MVSCLCTMFKDPQMPSTPTVTCQGTIAAGKSSETVVMVGRGAKGCEGLIVSLHTAKQ